MYKCIKGRPDNLDTALERKEKEQKVAAAFFKYMASTGPFEDFMNEREQYVETMVCTAHK